MFNIYINSNKFQATVFINDCSILSYIMQKVSPRIIKRRFKHWVFVFRTALIIFTIVLVGYSLCFDFQINNNEMTTLKSNELDTTPTIHVQTLAVDELPMVNYFQYNFNNI